MIIITPSRERAHSLTSLRLLPASWAPRVRLLVNEKERDTYAASWPGYTIWTHARDRISAIRQDALEMADDDKVLMLDDDLQFYVRRQYDPPRLRNAGGEDLDLLWAATDHLLGPNLPLIGVSFRQHNDATVPPYSYNTRVDRMYAFYRPVLQELGFRYDAVDLLENFHLTLSVLRAGYPSMVWWHWAQGQPASNSPGGCSTYRTAEYHGACVKQFAALHAPFVEVVHGKKTKTSWEGIGERDDVICEWAAAYDFGRRLRGVPPPMLDLRAWLPEEALNGAQPGLF